MDRLSNSSRSLPPSFSLQDALSSWGPSATLYTNGCNQTDQKDGAKNCTAACQDPYQAFNTLETLNNCLLYIGIADAYASQNLSSNDIKLADELVIQKSELASPVSQNVNSTITTCFDAYCDGLPACMGLTSSAQWGGTPPDTFHDDSTNFDNYSTNFNPYNFSYRDQADYLCEYIAQSSPLNSDIGGIGVYASYWIQSGLALLGTFLVLLWGLGTRYICLPSMAGRHGNNATKPANGISVTFEKRRLASLTAALTDFQKSQCFFMLAVNIAALVNKANGGLSPVSLQQLYDNYSLLASVAISGSLPITATLLALHMVDMISDYLLALSGCTVALSIATVAAIGNFNPSSDDLGSIRAQSRNDTYPECGNLDLSVYCLSTYQDTDPNNTYVWGIMAYCLLVLFYILAYHLNAFKDPLKNQTRPWVLRMVSWMSSTRTLQFVLVPLALVFNRSFSTLILGSLTLTYLAFLPICRLRCARRINSTGFISFRCGLDLLAWVSWLADFAFSLDPVSFFVWVTFTISTIQLLRKAYVEDSNIRKWALKYRHFAYWDKALPTSSLGNRSIGTHLQTSSTTIMKASITLVTLISRRIDKLEERAASHDWPRKFRRFLLICLYWMIFLGGIVSFAFIFLGLAAFQDKIDTKTWTFGQIVAITVWAPPLCEYFHLELRGMKRGFQHRLLPPYKVVASVTTAHPVP
ncbi:MAG: hypothetical protein ALECFALPRED_006095 [Alectoria fallacina]|uniref:Uncharacterized protein n=1 Tax=Alectoria fallacina TaxID=1903189 RepID=A0A8H3G812_9LECA|nr:MAG: hypothetical protein ALECFALPRED_006095 [Alectoria fallacina]